MPSASIRLSLIEISWCDNQIARFKFIATSADWQVPVEHEVSFVRRSISNWSIYGRVVTLRKLARRLTRTQLARRTAPIQLRAVTGAGGCRWHEAQPRGPWIRGAMRLLACEWTETVNHRHANSTTPQLALHAAVKQCNCAQQLELYTYTISWQFRPGALMTVDNYFTCPIRRLL